MVTNHYTTRPGGLIPAGASHRTFREACPRIPSATKVGKYWVLTVEAWDAWIATRPRKTPKLPEADQGVDLSRMGLRVAK